MSFVVVAEICDLAAAFAQGGDDLLGLADRYARVVRAVHHEQRTA